MVRSPNITVQDAHNSPASATRVVGADVPRATPADAARTIVGRSGTGTLSTLSVAPAGYPFGSVVSFAADDAGQPLFVISELAEHTRNLRADPRSSLLVTEAADDGDPLAIGRVTLIGRAALVPVGEQTAAKAHVVERLPAVGGYASFNDFSCWRLTVESVRWVGGFGRMDWVDAASYESATVDAVLAGRRGVIEHMNADHADAGVEMCQHALDHDTTVPPPTVTAATFDLVDRYGCDYVAATSEGPAYVRLGFDAPAASVDEVRAAIISLLRAARRP